MGICLMILQFTPFAIIYLVTIAIGLYLFHLAEDISFAPGRKLVRLVIIGTIVWYGMYALQLLVIDPGIFLISILIGITGIYMIVSALLLFALSYTGREQYVNPVAFVLLMITPLLILSGIATNQYFSLFYTSISTYAVGDLILYLLEYGPFFWVHTGYLYLLTGFTIFLLLIALMDYPSLYRRQIGILILVILLPLVTEGVFILKFGPFPGLQITPVILILVSGILLFASSRYHLFSVLPRTQARIPEQLNDGLLIMNPDGILIYMNPAAEGYLSISSDQAVGKKLADICPSLRIDDGARELSVLDGTILEVRKNPLLKTHASEEIIILHDITIRRRAEKGLREANRQLSLLSSITRHDILNQITVVQGYIELSRDKEMDAELSRYFEEMKRATEKIQYEIEFTRVYQDLGTQEPQWQEIDSILRAPCRTRLICECDGYAIYADPMLPKVFENLFDNALRHGGRVTEISVICKEVDGSLRIAVVDDGTGIASEEKERIFERGYGKNTGFGLFLVRDILAITGITIHEEGVPGEGARFVMIVPEGGWRRDRE
jgi:signal transduction histidine kinase